MGQTGPTVGSGMMAMPGLVLPHGRSAAVRAQQPGGGGSTDGTGEESTSPIVYFLALALVAAAAATFWRTPLEDTLGDTADALEDLLSGATFGWGAGDAVGALLWSVTLWFVTPLQLLLLFLGKFDTERPSDEIIGFVGRAAGLPVDDVGYEAPKWVLATAATACVLGGIGIAALLSVSLGDATWSVSAGMGALAAAVVYEVGRPERMSGQKAVELEEQWQDFARFCDRRLQRGGRCHESEVWSAFRRENAKYRSQDVLPDSVLRTMVLNWHPEAERTRNGFYKNLSVQASVDPFSGKLTGSGLPARPLGAAAGSAVDGGSGGSGSSSSSSGSGSSGGVAGAQPGEGAAAGSGAAVGGSSSADGA